MASAAPPPDLLRDKFFMMRVNAEERDRYKALAAARGLSLAGLICLLLDREARRVERGEGA